MVDQSTEKKLGLNFFRLLVEVSMNVTLPNSIILKNEKGQLIRQKVQYDGGQFYANIVVSMVIQKIIVGRSKLLKLYQLIQVSQIKVRVIHKCN